MSLFMQNKDRLHAYILCCVPYANDAEDILQDTCVVLFERFDDYEENTNFLAWSIQIAKYKILEFRKKHKNTKLVFSDHELGIVENGDLSNRFDTLDEEFSALRFCLKELSPRHRRLLQYRYEYDMSFRSIAKRFNVSMQAICKLNSRINMLLLKCMRSKLKETL